MVLLQGKRWHCSSLACGCTVLAQSGTGHEGGDPLCSCGSHMKKAFKPPAFSYLDFLRLDPPLVSAREPDRD